MLCVRLMHVGETLNRFAILGCELYKNVVDCRAPPGPAGGAKGKERVWNRDGEEGEGTEGRA